MEGQGRARGLRQLQRRLVRALRLTRTRTRTRTRTLTLTLTLTLTRTLTLSLTLTLSRSELDDAKRAQISQLAAKVVVVEL